MDKIWQLSKWGGREEEEEWINYIDKGWEPNMVGGGMMVGTGTLPGTYCSLAASGRVRL